MCFAIGSAVRLSAHLRMMRGSAIAVRESKRLFERLLEPLDELLHFGRSNKSDEACGARGRMTPLVQFALIALPQQHQ